MGALGHFLESEGIATTQISLIYEHTAGIRPPRALWVPFELGRPLGVPNDPAFQMGVLQATLDLFDEASGPVLREYPHAAPHSSDTDQAWACPVNFQSRRESECSDDLLAVVLSEISDLAPWFAFGQERRGRSTFGVSGLPVQDCAKFLNALLSVDGPEGGIPDAPLGESLKRMSEDLFAWYSEAAAAQPGESVPTSRALEDWFWGETQAGHLLLTLARTRSDHSDPLARRVIERNLVPWTQSHRLN